MKKFTFLMIVSLFAGNFLQLAAENFTVIIDAGHGGKDPGAICRKYKEKDINLAVALNLGKLIEDNLSDVKVIYTRRSDVFVDLYKRAEIGNKAKGNLFISIHTNSTAEKSTAASGADTYILGLARSEENRAAQQRENAAILYEDNYKQRYQNFDPNSPESHIIFEFMTNKFMEQSLEFGNSLQENFRTVARRTDRGVKQAGFLVLRETAMPSVLIELGFINNSSDAKYLASAIGQRSLASAIYAGFKQYKKEFDKKQGSKIVASDSDNNNNPSEETAYVSKPSQPLTQQPVAARQSEDVQPTVQQQPIGESQTYISKPKQEPVIGNRPKPSVQTPPKTAPTGVQPQKPERTVAAVQPARTEVKPNETEYRIQILTADFQLVPESSKFKGISPVSFYVHNGAYKYTYGSTTDKDEASRLLRQVKSKFKDAFIVEFRNGERIK
ncbi:MAG: N-acetylmuramoyl-L-alanine amidase [Prevotella sp.]|jgi:N-acetylmuramoyl-L-alanine amidase|nr:N-acetylmuramoyl-L-alanine amidase [Prevotella sp.]